MNRKQFNILLSIVVVGFLSISIEIYLLLEKPGYQEEIRSSQKIFYKYRNPGSSPDPLQLTNHNQIVSNQNISELYLKIESLLQHTASCLTTNDTQDYIKNEMAPIMTDDSIVAMESSEIYILQRLQAGQWDEADNQYLRGFSHRLSDGQRSKLYSEIGRGINSGEIQNMAAPNF